MLKLLILTITCLFLTGCNELPTQPTTPSSQSGHIPFQQPTPELYDRQLTIVRRSQYKKQSLLNRSEQKVFWALIEFCQNKDYRIFPQVSLGEILSAEQESYSVINSKRVDFCLTNKQFIPLAVIEYQGKGHKNQTSSQRDSVKKQSAEKAGILYIPILFGEEHKVSSILSDKLCNIKQG
jgi:hypothetical protein